jgi:hypothetical protein
MKELIIKSAKYGDKTCLYDDQFEAVISQFKWCLSHKRGIFYAIAHGLRPNGKIGTIRMHRLFLAGDIIDHKDGNGLNNQLRNLRSATPSQNSQNKSVKNRTGFKGVHKRKNSYYAIIRNTSKKLIHLGVFKTAEEAAIKYNSAAILYHGEFARLNIL